MTWGYNQYSIHSACLKKEKDIIKLILGVGFKLCLKRLKKCFLTPIFVMILTHLGSKFICWSIFAYGLLFVELFAWCKSLCGVMYTAKSSSAESLTTRKQAQRCKWLTESTLRCQQLWQCCGAEIIYFRFWLHLFSFFWLRLPPYIAILKCTYSTITVEP